MHGCFLAISSHFLTDSDGRGAKWEVLGSFAKTMGISDVTASVCITMCCGSVLFRRIQVEEYEKGYGKGPYGTREVSLCRLDFLISKECVADFEGKYKFHVDIYIYIFFSHDFSLIFFHGFPASSVFFSHLG